MDCSPVIVSNIYSMKEFQREKDLTKRIHSIALKYHIGEVLLIDTSDICVAEWVQLKCKYGCKKYGRSWCCPPETPTPDQTKTLLSEYKRAVLLCGSTKSINFHKDNHQKRRKQVHVWKGTVAIERQLFLSGYYKAFALVAENCALCKDCLYPDACRFPTDRRPSVESLSIDVFQTLKSIGKKFRLAKAVGDEHDYYSFILLE